MLDTPRGRHSGFFPRRGWPIRWAKQQTKKHMALFSKNPTLRRAVVIILIVVSIGLLVAGGILVRRQQASANRNEAYGRMCQMRVALQSYESEHGRLPPLCLRNDHGDAIQSWRALILPYLSDSFPSNLNLSQPWSSDFNRIIIESIPQGDWVWFFRDRRNVPSPLSTNILAYVGRKSIWDTKTGLPKGKTTELPDAILLIWIPRGNLHPLQPGDISEEEVRERLEEGEEVLFIAASSGYRYGVVTLERGELEFHATNPEAQQAATSNGDKPST